MTLFRSRRDHHPDVVDAGPRPRGMSSPAGLGATYAGLRVLDLDRKSTRLNSRHTEIYTLSLHDALPISSGSPPGRCGRRTASARDELAGRARSDVCGAARPRPRSEEHTSELPSHRDLHSFPT